MTLKDLLNSDLDTVGRWIRQGWLWWVRELRDMVPPGLRREGRHRTPWVAELPADAGAVRLWRNGAFDGPLAAPDGVRRRADLVLPRTAVLVQDLTLPRLSGGDLDRLVAHNIDRFTPLRPDQVYFDTAILDRSGAGATQRVRLGVLTRERAEAALTRAAALGLDIERMGVAPAEGDLTLQFDFMRAIRAGASEPALHRRRTWLWVGCAGLLAANLLTAVLQDMSDVSQLQSLVDTQRPSVALATRLRKSVETEQARRVNLLLRRSRQDPLRIFDVVTRALPKSEWVQRLEWNGRTVRLVGSKAPEFDVASALDGGRALRNARSLLSDMPTKSANNQTPFDVLADSAAPSPAPAPAPK